MRSGDAVEPAADPRAESALGSEASSHAPSAMVPTRGGLFVWPAIYGNEGHFVWPTIYGNGGRFVRPAIYGNGGRFVSPAIYGHGGRLVRPAVGQDDQRERRGEGGGWRGWGWEGLREWVGAEEAGVVGLDGLGVGGAGRKGRGGRGGLRFQLTHHARPVAIRGELEIRIPGA